ncbi:MAG: CaiB/BaiF CoA transferase family protein, partial [Pseudonocardiaceae bacterium]
MGALSGVVVADFSRVLAAPYATMLMADLGADVIKVEHPERGDDTSSWGPPFAADEATYFLSVNRNKRSLGLDLSQAEGRRQARELASSADVVVENFRPGTMAKYGLSYADIRELNPRVVYCSITGFGSGAGAPLPGYDLLVQAVGGLMSVTGSAPGGYTLASAVPGILGNRHSSIAPYEVFATSDGPIVLAVGNDRQFAALCRGLGVDGLAQDSRFVTNPQRVAHVDELAEL